MPTPYLFFNGRCEEAIDLYKQALGAKVEMLMRFKDSPEPPPPGTVPEGSEAKVMHACITINGTSVMMTDGCASDGAGFKGFSLSVNARDDAEADSMFAALANGGTVAMPMGETFFARRFGMVTDRFGVGWMVITGEKN